jgi:GAF domain-containing protein
MYEQAEAKSQLQKALIQAISQVSTLDAAFSVTLSKICEVTDWDYGEAWIPEKDGTILKLSPAWCISPHKDSDSVLALEQFRHCSEKFVLHPNEGLPGRVWSSQQPEWIADTSAKSETYFLRNKIAKAFGIKAGLGVPIFVGSQIIAVFAFFMSEVRDEDKQLIELTQAATTQLGQLLPRFLNG